MISITQIHTYPVKGLRGINAQSARVLARGFELDREWMIVDEDNRFVTQRDISALATIETELTRTHLILKHPEESTLQIMLEHIDAVPQTVTVWKDSCQAVDQGSDASVWLTRVLKGHGQLRLMRFAPDAVRAVEQKYLDGIDAEVGFADGYPYLVTNEASLEKLNTELDEVVPMNRFRPNIVLRGLPPYDEHKITQLTVRGKDVTMLLPKPCQRCKVTTINQRTGEVAASREPLRTLIRTNSLPGFVGGYFGQNGVAISGLGTELVVGDTVDVTYA